jgi:hypothetical protein
MTYKRLMWRKAIRMPLVRRGVPMRKPRWLIFALRVPML